MLVGYMRLIYFPELSQSFARIICSVQFRGLYVPLDKRKRSPKLTSLGHPLCSHGYER
jgi:hypothetical protein